MRKTLLMMLLLMVLALSACQSSTPPPAETASVENPTLVDTPTARAAGTSTPVQPAETAASDTAPVSGNTPGCVASSPFPTAGPTEQSLFPPPGERDWVKGPDSATVTFTEYSDFQ